MRFKIAVLFLVIGHFLNAQNAYLFVEPCASLSYDSSVYKIGSKFSDGFTDKEEYFIDYIADTSKKRFIYFKSEPNTEWEFTTAELDKGF